MFYRDQNRCVFIIRKLVSLMIFLTKSKMKAAMTNLCQILFTFSVLILLKVTNHDMKFCLITGIRIKVTDAKDYLPVW